MKTKIIEATSNRFNWGKFCLARFDDEEWSIRSPVADENAEGYTPSGVIAGRGWSRAHLWVLDLQTGEGAFFHPGGAAQYDLNKHKIWVCPLFEPFLGWLYQQDLTDLDALPAVVDLPHAKNAMHGYRRPGPIMNAIEVALRERGWTVDEGVEENASGERRCFQDPEGGTSLAWLDAVLRQSGRDS